jgi:hypothetical protein
MAITYNWTIANCEHDIATGGIIIAHWRVTAEETVGEETYTASSYGTCHFRPDATDPNFKPYDQVTEAEVLAWCCEGDSGVDKDSMEAALAENINAQKNPTEASGLPWA